MNLCHRFVPTILLLTISFHHVFAQVPPKREFRGAWIATVVNLDWPSSSTWGKHPDVQRLELTNILNGLKSAGINAVVFQIRPECDALYFSLIEPWSYWLTGMQGAGPSAPFDPLLFAILEAHQRGMELHAWFNPYRAERQVGSYSLSPDHITVKRPDLTKDYPIYSGTYPNRRLTGYLRILNPGLEQARNHIISVVMDVVRRYDIDGVHFDDYFYPYPTSDSLNQPVAFPDSDTYFQNNPESLTLGDWRRKNVDVLIHMLSDSIKSVKPRVKFGISPFGIWKSGNPQGIVGTSAYDAIYCDAVKWLNERWIDYIAPQLYWPFGGGQDYAKLMPWWAGQAASTGRHLYTGQASYRITDPQHNWGPSEVPNQIRLNRASSPGAQGSIFFRANMGVTDNPKGFADSLKNDLYQYPALRPIMAWKETTPPNPPVNLTITKFSTTALLTWTAPGAAPDGEAASSYAVYRSTSRPIDINDARNLVYVGTSLRYDEMSLPTGSVTYYYAVTALDKLQNESVLSNLVGIDANGVVGVEQQPTVIAGFRLRQNYPNPFNPSTIISFNLPTEQKATLRVYDILGREIKVLVDGVLGPGEHQYQFDARGLATGVYIYRLVAGSFVESKKMQLVR